MKKVWLTYAWQDNEDKDIDFIITELDKVDISLKFDRRNLIAGQRLWPQIGGHITDPNECEAWGIVLTKNSINSPGCIEELCYALNRALGTNGDSFPIFALLNGISPGELPPALKIRLCIPLENNNWAEQVVAAANKAAPGFIPPSNLGDYVFQEHQVNDGFCLEIRPRFDRISPFAVAVAIEEKTIKGIGPCFPGPANIIPNGGVQINWFDHEDQLTDGTRCWIWQGNNEVNSTSSYFLFYKEKPKRIWCGHPHRIKMYKI